MGATSVTVTTGTEAASGTFTVTAGTPVLTTIAPSSGQQGQTLTVQITGQYTHFGASSAVSFGNSGVTAGTVTVTDATHLTATVTAAATAAVGATSVTVTTGTEVVAATGTFTVTAGTPVLSTVAPSSGQQGQTLTVQITGQYTHFGASSAVSFGNSGVTAGTITVTDATHLTATVTVAATAAVGATSVTVTTGTEVATVRYVHGDGGHAGADHDCSQQRTAGPDADGADHRPVHALWSQLGGVFRQQRSDGRHRHGDRRYAPDGYGYRRRHGGGGRNQRRSYHGRRGGQRYVHGDGGDAGAEHGRSQQRTAGAHADGADHRPVHALRSQLSGVVRQHRSDGRHRTVTDATHLTATVAITPQRRWARPA